MTREHYPDDEIWANDAAEIDAPDTALYAEAYESGPGKIPPRAGVHNKLFNRDNNMLQHIEQNGIPRWDSRTAYPIGGHALGSDGVIYRSLTADNTNNDPTTDSVNWSRIVGDLPVPTEDNAGDSVRVNQAGDGYILADDRVNWIRAGLLGSGLAIAGASIPALAALNGTDVAFIDSDNTELRTYRFDGSEWSQVGSGLPITDALSPALAALNGTDVAFIDATNEELRTYRFDGSEWSQVGSGLTVPGFLFGCDLTALNDTDVAFIDSDNNELRTYRFDGSEWSQVGSGLTVTNAGSPALAALNGTDVAFIDATNDELRTYRFAFYTGAGPWALRHDGFA